MATTPLSRIYNSDLFYSFTHSPAAIISAIVALLILLGAVSAPWVAPHNPFDLASVNLLNDNMPPAWALDGNHRLLPGTHNQGHDISSSILYGSPSSRLGGLALGSITLFRWVR